mmetsp:Transcript_36347/g.85806  ORF Transcript_36347/g.85806 Transcript_36347/m.85806 type:complete len:278 (+) Transcript_36347:964-1797(+)
MMKAFFPLPTLCSGQNSCLRCRNLRPSTSRTYVRSSRAIEPAGAPAGPRHPVPAAQLSNPLVVAATAALKLIPVLLCPGLHQACCAPVHHQQCLHHLINHLTPLPFHALRAAREVRHEGGKYIIYVLPLRLGTLIPQSLVHCLRLTVSRTAPLSGWRQPEAHLAPATRLRAPLSQPAWPVCVPPCSAPAPRPTPLRPLPRGTLRAYSVAARHPVSPAIHRSPRTRHQAATARPSRWLRCAAVSSCFFFFSSHGRHLSSSSSMPLPSSSPSNCESWRA